MSIRKISWPFNKVLLWLFILWLAGSAVSFGIAFFGVAVVASPPATIDLILQRIVGLFPISFLFTVGAGLWLLLIERNKAVAYPVAIIVFFIFALVLSASFFSGFIGGLGI